MVKRWTKRPPPRTEIDYTHSLAHKLSCFVICNGVDIYDAVTGGSNIALTGETPSIVGREQPYGQGLIIPSGASASTIALDLGRGYHIQEFNAEYSSAMCGLEMVNNSHAASSDHSFRLQNTAANRYISMGLRPHTGTNRRHFMATSLIGSSNIALNETNSDNVHPYDTPGIALCSFNLIDGASTMLHSNGLMGNVTVDTGTAQNYVFDQVLVQNIHGASGVDRKYYFFAAWLGRSLSESEMRSLQANPYQIFKPKSRVAFIDIPEDKRFVKVKTPWTKQPPKGTPIDWSNPLTKGLQFFAPVDSLGTDIVSGEAPTIEASATCKMSQVIFEERPDMSGWCFDTRGASESGPDGFWWGLGQKNGTFPRNFYNRTDDSLGLTTMSWGRRETNTVAWQVWFGIVRTGDPYYQGCLIQNNLTDNFRLRWSDSHPATTTQDTTSDPIVTKSAGIDQFVATFQNTGSASRLTLYKNGVQDSLFSSVGSGESVELDVLNTTTCGIVANAYAPSDSADVLQGLTTANAIWNRELSADEVNSMYQNPWQIFKQREDLVPVSEKLPDLAKVEVPW